MEPAGRKGKGLGNRWLSRCKKQSKERGAHPWPPLCVATALEKTQQSRPQTQAAAWKRPCTHPSASGSHPHDCQGLPATLALTSPDGGQGKEVEGYHLALCLGTENDPLRLLWATVREWGSCPAQLESLLPPRTQRAQGDALSGLGLLPAPAILWSQALHLRSWY